ncbi:uncharacterized protein RHOBADRAFT_43034 [Rhodotorula graminis WP1]|uniref:Uncharacterized protein n=1 Tax=Rhodotorula graminis (strain WP1) TaxID=578459 RepID=A0A194S877_RHOGW|nr:uncharacterized protein RHOBADRAFT_43034 [Rhodotorula graminis WP1]KPV75611.1 hypothetical protein RHOBADRAFT_43034 [Rhodotorula graminis WP1]
MKLLSLRSLVNKVDSRPDPPSPPTASSSRPASTGLSAQVAFPSIQLRRQRPATARAPVLATSHSTPIEVEGTLFDTPLVSSPRGRNPHAVAGALANSAVDQPPPTSMPVQPTRFGYGEEPYSFNETPSLKVKPWTRLLNSSRRSFRKRDSSASVHGPPSSPSPAPRPSLSTIKAAPVPATFIGTTSSTKSGGRASAPASPAATSRSLVVNNSLPPVDGFPPRRLDDLVPNKLPSVDETTSATSPALVPPPSPTRRRARRQAVVDGSPSASGGSSGAVGQGSGRSTVDGSAAGGSAPDGSALDGSAGGSGLGSSSSGRRLDGSAGTHDGSVLGASALDGSALDGSALDRSALDGSALDGSALESSGSGRAHVDGSASGLDGTADGSANEVGRGGEGEGERSDADDSDADFSDWRRRPAPSGRTVASQSPAHPQARVVLLDSEGSTSAIGGAGERGSWPPTGLPSRFSDWTTTGTGSSRSAGQSLGGQSHGLLAPAPVPVSPGGPRFAALILLADVAASSVSFDLGHMSRAKAFELRNAGRRASTG